MNNEEKILSMLGNLVQDMTEMKQEMSNMKQEMSETKDTVNRIEQNVIHIENDHGQKIQGALDGYSAVYDISKEIRADVADIKDALEAHDIHIKVLENVGR